MTNSQIKCVYDNTAFATLWEKGFQLDPEIFLWSTENNRDFSLHSDFQTS